MKRMKRQTLTRSQHCFLPFYCFDYNCCISRIAANTEHVAIYSFLRPFVRLFGWTSVAVESFVAAMPPLSNTQRAGATIALMQSMLLLLGLLYEIILQEQSHVRRVEEENRKRRREELNEHLLLVFEADRLIRRGVMASQFRVNNVARAAMTGHSLVLASSDAITVRILCLTMGSLYGLSGSKSPWPTNC
jgi:hypothetical protein